MKNIFTRSVAYVAVAMLLPMLALSCKKDSTATAQQNTTTTTTTATTSGTTDAPAYKLIWADEFDSTAVNTNKWNFETGNLHVNNELEYYQAANASVSNGNLVITARQESVGGQPYTSARLNTQNKFSVKYGRIEARIKMPQGAGLWPAFWMLGNSVNTLGWPKCGEIDIMEHVNADSIIYGTMHWATESGSHTQYGLTTPGSPAQYHVYAVEWDSSSIKWYIDDKLYVTGNISNNVNNTEEFNSGNFFILLNMAVGGDLPRQQVDLSKIPAKMYVDYVRVYKRSS